MILRVEPARPDHTPALLANLRQWEKDRLALIENPERLLAEQIAESDMAFAGLFDDELAWLWGLKPMAADTVYVWLVTTRAVEEHPLVFLRYLRHIAENILAAQETIEADVFADNLLVAKWLKWLGADLEPSSRDGILAVKLRRSGWASKRLASSAA